ncbi:uncharacterized protein FFM5_15323 [Fusarium fujikuroi]|nr:uncharacterized protein FFM5_15323 [Fusarium fujikuroi]
MPFNLPFKPP